MARTSIRTQHWLMAGLCILVALSTVVYLTMPDRHTVSWAVMGLSGVTAILLGVRIHRPARRWPWYLLALANLTFTAGDTTYNILNTYFDQQNPFPSLADPLYLATYPLFAAGLFGFIRARTVGRDLPGLLDALVLTLGLGLLSWVFLINPLAHAADLTWVQRTISIAYPLGDVLILAMLARLLTAGGIRSRAVQFLTIGTLGILTSDALYGIGQLAGTWQVGTPLDLGWVIFFTAWGMAALQPSMVELTAPAYLHHAGAPIGRLVVLAAASLAAPGVLLWQSMHGEVRDAAVIAGFSALLFLLVMVRLTGIVLAHRRILARERALRLAAGSLVAAVSMQDISDAVRAAVSMIFGGNGRHGSAVLVGQRDGALAPVTERCCDEESRETGTEGPEPEAQPVLTMPSTSRLATPRELGVSGEQGLLCPLELRNRPAGDPLVGALAVAGPRTRVVEFWDTFEALASQTALALERIGLSREIIRRNSEAYFRTLVHNTSDIILILDDDDTVRYASPSVDAMLGDVPLTGAPLSQIVDPRDRQRAAAVLERMREGEGRDSKDDWRLLGPAGKPLDVEARCSNLRSDETVHGLVVTLRDVTEQRQLERELVQRAFHDPLTGLPNRSLLMERIERSLLRGRRESTLTCVLFVDLDDFKVINDTMGHSVGDELLVEVSRRLSSSLRASDTAARLGGDEFAVLMEDALESTDAESLAAQIVQTLGQEFRLRDGVVYVTASVGIATSQDGSDAEELLGHADMALYAAKTAGKRQWWLYQPVMHAGMLERHELQSGMDSALADEAFAVRYQPIVDLSGGRIAGFEALARWPHVRRGLVPPEEFIALAEETGHILSLGAWVLRKAVTEIEGWQRLVPGPDPLYASVNVSARQFRDPAFPDLVREILDASDLAPGTLVLELTESVLARRDKQIRSTMETLNDLGVGMAIDDFGTGFSSLSYLRDFPIDILKIDKSFINRISADEQQVALVSGIVGIADALGLQVIAEGIEDTVQRDLLSSMGCRFGQGYLFARPLTADQAELLLRESHDRHLPQLTGPEQRLRPTANGPSAATTRRAANASGGRGPGMPPDMDTAQGPSPQPSEPETAHPARAAGSAGAQSRRDPRWGDLERLRLASPMYDAVIDEVQGRHIRIGDDWLVDFASCNYLGFDLDPEIMAAIEPQVRRWGTHPSWSRLLGNPRLYPDIEERLTELLGAPDTLVLPTITLIHNSVIPALAGEGHVFVEATAHRTIYDGSVVARAQGATVKRFHADRPDELLEMLRQVPAKSTRLICLDGTSSMTGNLPDLAELAAVAREYGALLYVDDAHGFGVIGERGADEQCPYGSRGNSIVRHLGETYDDIILVGGFSKAYSALLAFLALPTWLKDHLKVSAAPYLYSGPSPTASLATVLAGFDVNERRGDALRTDIHRKTKRFLGRLGELGIGTPNDSGLPIVEIPLADGTDLMEVGSFLWERGIYVTLAAYPLVPRNSVGFRVQITAANTDADIDQLNDAMAGLAERFPLRPGL